MAKRIKWSRQQNKTTSIIAVIPISVTRTLTESGRMVYKSLNDARYLHM
jgi:hypothetical protein